MIIIQQLKYSLKNLHTHSQLLEILKSDSAKILGVGVNDIAEIRLQKKSYDARNKEDIQIVCNISVDFVDPDLIRIKDKQKNLVIQADRNRDKIRKFQKNASILYLDHIEENDLENYILNMFPWSNSVKHNSKYPSGPVIIGTGPAGLFAGLVLAYAGEKPILIEQGDPIEIRDIKIRDFFYKSILDENSNVQFGQGGAGTYSDGKLMTRINNPNINIVFNTFVKFGAPADILFSANPHIGTDILKNVVKNICSEIHRLGGEFHYQTKLIDYEENRRQGEGMKLVLRNVGQESSGIEGNFTINAGSLILATGHSSRQIYRMLAGKGVEISRKPFSMGVRIEHKRKMIEENLYGDFSSHPLLDSATYKLSYRYSYRDRIRGVYTFCMCPGGYVVAAASEKQTIVTNGMSYHSRDGENSNSAILVDIAPKDFPGQNPLDYLEFQENIEKKSYSSTLNSSGLIYQAPGIYLKDFMNGSNKKGNPGGFSTEDQVHPTYLPGVCFTGFDGILPNDIIDGIKIGISQFSGKIKGFGFQGSLLTGVETRSSSPLRIKRNEFFETNIKNLYVAGEGAGYAGGIVSSAVDGLSLGMSLLKTKYS